MSKMRASGRTRAKGSDKTLTKLQQRQSDWERMDAVTKATMKRPGSRQKHR